MLYAPRLIGAGSSCSTAVERMPCILRSWVQILPRVGLLSLVCFFFYLYRREVNP